MGRRVNILGAISVSVFLGGGMAHALDAGSPAFASEIAWEGRTELTYDRYDRTLAYKGVDATPESHLKLNLYGARLYLPVSRATVHLDGGILEGRKRNTTGVFLGAGGSLLAARFRGLDLHGTFALSYFPVLSYAKTSGETRRTYAEQVLEVWLGALATKDFRLKKGVHLTPHAGVALSVTRGKGKVDTTTADSADASGERYTIEEATPVVGVLGASVTLWDQVSFRTEGRFVGEQSLSAALGYAF